MFTLCFIDLMLPFYLLTIYKAQMYFSHCSWVRMLSSLFLNLQKPFGQFALHFTVTIGRFLFMKYKHHVCTDKYQDVFLPLLIQNGIHFTHLFHLNKSAYPHPHFLI